MNDFFLQPYEEKQEEAPKKKKDYFFDFLNDISYAKKGIWSDETKSSYKPYMINRFLSGSPDCVLFANDMNSMAHLDADMQYDYYFYSLRQKKRFAKWMKAEKNEQIDMLMEFYGYNFKRAKEVISLHTEKDFKRIQSALDKGGKTKIGKSG